MRLGIFGGSFNPIHHGHLLLATWAAEAARLDRVLFIPTGSTPLKDPADLAPARSRWAMVQLAIRDNPLFEASDVEARRPGPSYTVDTLRGLRRPGVRLHLMLGADALRLLPHWKESEAVKRMVRFLILKRPGHRLRTGLPKQLIVACPQVDVSGTEIRDRVRKGRPIRYFVPEAVERYIRKKGLYR